MPLALASLGNWDFRPDLANLRQPALVVEIPRDACAFTTFTMDLRARAGVSWRGRRFMKTLTSLLCVVVASVLLLGGCAPEAEPIDAEAEKAALLEADKAWSETPPDMEAFVSFFAEDGHFLTPDGPLAVGAESIAQTASQLFTAPGFSLTWKATKADVSNSGDLGYTIGTFELAMNDAEGNPVTRNGKYTTVWRKRADGQWKVVADAPNFDSPATGQGQ